MKAEREPPAETLLYCFLIFIDILGLLHNYFWSVTLLFLVCYIVIFGLLL